MNLVVGLSSRAVVSPVIGLGSITVTTSVVVMGGVTEEKCSRCCEFSIGCKATSSRCCEWIHIVSGVAVVSGVSGEK